MPIKYILDGKMVVAESNMFQWANWFEKSGHECVVEQTKYPFNVLVSTVFRGLNKRFHFPSNNKLVLFETMVFGGEHSQKVTHCDTWEQAEAMHKAMCEFIESSGENDHRH